MLMAFLSACAPNASTAAPAYHDYVIPPACPYQTNTIQFSGDSVSRGITEQVSLPGYAIFNAGEGGSSYSLSTSTLPSIGERVIEWIEQCGSPMAVVMSGSTNDFSHHVPLADLKTAVSVVSQYLAAKNIPVIWMTMHPVPNTGGWSQQMAADRLAYNDWLMQPGNVVGTVVDSTPALQDPSDHGWLNPAYYRAVALGGYDPLHPSDAGYKVLAGLEEAALERLLNP